MIGIHILFYDVLIFFLRLSVPVSIFFLLWKLWDLYNLSQKDWSSSLPLPPGSFGFPIIGETIDLVMNDKEFYNRRMNRYGNVFKTNILGMPVIRVIGADNIRPILNGENLIVTSNWPKSTQVLLGKGSLAMSSGILHKKRRRIILRAFTNEALAGYVADIQSVICKYIQGWCGESSVSVYPEFRRMTFEIACRVLLGLNVSRVETEKLTETFEIFESNLFSLPLDIPGLGFHKGMQARKKVIKAIRECLLRHTSYDSSNDFDDAMSKLLGLEDEIQLTTSEIEDSILELMFTGHSTLTSAIFSLIIQLSNHPEVVDKLRIELSNNNLLSIDNNTLVYEKVNNLRYVGNIVKEVLRITPPVGAGYRKVLRTFTINGYQIPKGWSVAYSIRETHEISKLFGSADFDPDRWNQSYQGERFSYIPFGGSKNRDCVGKDLAKLEMSIFIIELVRNCSWKMVNGIPKIRYLPTPHPVNDMPMTFVENKSNGLKSQ